MRLKKVFYIFVLLSLFSVPGTGWAADPMYTVTEQELTQLEGIFNQLKTRQQEQAQQIETLKTQLTQSEQEIKRSQDSLNKANQSLQQSAEETKRTHDRLERQRDTWAVVAAIVLGVAVMNT